MISLREAGITVEAAQSGRMVRRTILHPLSLDLGERRIAVVGANGSGKSSFLRLLNGLTAPTRGSVEVNGLDTRKDAARVRRQVGFIFTDPLHQLVMTTPADDIELSLRSSIKDRKGRRAAARQLLDARGLGQVAESSIYDLSGGERQLVSLTTVLAVEPSIIIADEPTTLLDLRNRREVIDALTALDQQLIVATHDLDFAATADRVLVIDEGRLVHDGNPNEAIEEYRRRMLGGL